MAVEGDEKEETQLPPLLVYAFGFQTVHNPDALKAFRGKKIKRLENCAQRDDGFVKRVRTKKQTNII